MNVSPKGKSIGYQGKPQPKEFDEMTKNMLKYVETASAMEDSTERSIKNIERLRRDTLQKAELGPRGDKP
jgi:hypothetical protein